MLSRVGWRLGRLLVHIQDCVEGMKLEEVVDLIGVTSWVVLTQIDRVYSCLCPS